MNVLITGGAGFIGSHLAHRLIGTSGVTVLDDLSTGSRDNLAGLSGHPSFRFVRGSVLDSALVDTLVANSGLVVHLAAAVGVRRILREPIEAMRTNVQGTETVLDACNRHRRKVLIASTSEVYGKNPRQPLCETSDSVFGSSAIRRWSYATAKKLDEFMAQAYHDAYGLPVIVTRFFNVVGPRQTGRYGMVLPNFIRAALAGSPIKVFGDGLQTRNFTSIADCLNAVAALLAEPLAEGQIFNIGGALEISIADLARRVKTLTGSSSPIQFVPYEEAYPEGSFEDMRSRVPCICKIKALTGWQPRIALDQIVTETAQSELRRIPASQLAGLSERLSDLTPITKSGPVHHGVRPSAIV
jgi:UDP-glucose 4-epimerase